MSQHHGVHFTVAIVLHLLYSIMCFFRYTKLEVHVYDMYAPQCVLLQEFTEVFLPPENYQVLTVHLQWLPSIPQVAAKIKLNDLWVH